MRAVATYKIVLTQWLYYEYYDIILIHFDAI